MVAQIYIERKKKERSTVHHGGSPSSLNLRVTITVTIGVVKKEGFESTLKCTVCIQSVPQSKSNPPFPNPLCNAMTADAFCPSVAQPHIILCLNATFPFQIMFLFILIPQTEMPQPDFN